MFENTHHVNFLTTQQDCKIKGITNLVRKYYYVLNKVPQSKGNIMAIPPVSAYSLIASLMLIISASSSASINPVSNAPIAYDHLQQFYETTEVADGIWNHLTNNFVDQYEASQYAKAAATAQTAYKLAENIWGPDDINTADSLLKLGIINETLGNLTQAKEHMLGSLVILETQLNPYHEDVAVVLTNLANVYFEEKQPDKAEEFHKRALEIRLKVFGDKHPVVAQSIYNLAVLYDELTEYDKAKDLYTKALGIWNYAYGTNHPYIANALNNLANVYMLTGDMSTAIELHQDSLSARRAIYGNEHPEVARSLINLGAVYVKNQNYDKAKPLYQEAISLAENLFGQYHPQVAMLLYNLANIYHIQGRIEANIKKQDRMLKSTQHANLKGDLMTVENTEAVALAANIKAKSYFKKAVPLYERALTILDKSIGSNHPAVSAMLNELVILYRSIGKENKAEKMLARLSEFNHSTDIHAQ